MKKLLEEYKTVREKIFANFGDHAPSYLEIDDCTEHQWRGSKHGVTFGDLVNNPDDAYVSGDLLQGPIASSCGKFVGYAANFNADKVFAIFDRSLECVQRESDEPPYDYVYKLKSERA